MACKTENSIISFFSKGEIVETYRCKLTKCVKHEGLTNVFLHTGQIEAENRADAEKKVHEEVSRIGMHSSALVVVKAEIMIDKKWQEIPL